MIGIRKSTLIYYELIGQTNKIVDRWEKIGLLEGLSKRKKVKCSIYFEECLSYLMFHETNNLERIQEDFEMIIFPIVRRVIDGIKLNINFNILYMINDFLKYYENNISKLREIRVQGIDIEAELCIGFSKFYIKKLNQDKIININ